MIQTNNDCDYVPRGWKYSMVIYRQSVLAGSTDTHLRTPKMMMMMAGGVKRSCSKAQATKCVYFFVHLRKYPPHHRTQNPNPKPKEQPKTKNGTASRLASLVERASHASRPHASRPPPSLPRPATPTMIHDNEN